MSYVEPNTSDSLNDWFSNMANFMNILPNILKATEKSTFCRWFDKLYEIDKRSLRLYLIKHKNKIDPEYYEYINIQYGQELLK